MDDNLTDQQQAEVVKQWLKDSAVMEDGQTTHDDYYGYGLLNVSGLIQQATQA